ncbi:TniQ protein [Palleronia aestuarii]|uniref:TniQ protein n=1 Tax=Palleronia aestuarii TaxID=568105 RepID=A0A2W7N256_9RHOB|nr:TniQ family protein [Palleronia aestuarii]PZX10954.1 TniQ protein [Palleronia aestuarii]
MIDASPLSPLSVTSHEDETFTSLLSRIAARNGAADLSDFRTDIGVRQEDILRPDAEALSALAIGAGVPDHPSLHRTPMMNADGQFVLGHARMTKSDLIRFRIRICLKCIRADKRRDRRFGPYQRFSWLLADVHACAEHSCLLEDITEASGTAGKLDFHRAVANTDPNILVRLGSKVFPLHRDLETYLVGRVLGHATNPFLDGLEYRVVASTARSLGCLVRFGPKTALSGLTPRDQRIAGHDGFQILSGGPTAIHDALEGIRMSKPLAATKHRMRFGTFFDSLRNRDDTAYAPIKDLVRDYILETFPVPEGTEVLGVTCRKQRRHTLATGAASIDMNRARLGHRLVERGLAYVRAGSAMPVLLDYISTDVLNEIKATEATAYDLSQVCEILGVHRNLVGRLAQNGFLGVQPVDGPGTYSFARNDVWLLKEQLFGFPFRRPLGPATHLPLFDAARQYRLPIETLIHLGRRGDLKLRHDAERERSLPNLLVCVAELEGQLRPKRSVGLVHLEAARLLMTDRRSISELVEAGKLVEKEIHLGYTARAAPYVTAESLRAFREEYVSLTQMAFEMNREPGPYAQHLAGRGIAACTEISSSAKFYRRKDFRRN